MLSRGYWNSSKRGQKYERDREKLTTHCNFTNIDDNIIEELCESNVVEKLDYPM